MRDEFRARGIRIRANEEFKAIIREAVRTKSVKKSADVMPDSQIIHQITDDIGDRIWKASQVEDLYEEKVFSLLNKLDQARQKMQSNPKLNSS